jgi:hypothetical protein
MRKLWLLISSMAALPAFGQLASNTLTISATRQINLQPDQVVFSLAVNSALNATLDQIIAALSGLGITSANLTGVFNNPTPQSLQWNFTLAVPFSSLAATIGSLAKLQQTITQSNSGLTLTFSVNGTQVSAQLRQSQSCSNSDLIADATAQAQKLTAAAGLVLGPVHKLSNAPSIQATDILNASASALVGYIVPNDFLLGSVPSPVTCSLVVEFQLQQ